MKRHTRNKISEIVLPTLLVVGVLTTAVIAPNALQLFKYFDTKNGRDRWKIRRSMKNLEQKGFVKKKVTQGKEEFTLTLSGKNQAMRYRLKELRIAPQKKWDGLWRIVMFDIPEEKRKARRAVARAIKDIGCTQYQKSVFITPYPCEQEIKLVGECFGVRKHIRLVVAQKIETEARAKKFFHL